MQTTVRQYRNSKDFRKDAEKMSRRGWAVVSQIQEKRPAGCARWAFLGILAPLFPKRPLIVVTYEKE